VRKVTHARKRNAWANRDELLHRCRGPRRNHVCQFVLRSLTVCGRGGGSNFKFLHWLASSPLQHSRTTVRVFALPCECVISDNHIETETRITQITRHAIMTDKSHLIQLFKKKLLLSQFHNSITKTQFWKKYNYVCAYRCAQLWYIYTAQGNSDNLSSYSLDHDLNVMYRSSSILYHFPVIWHWIISWPWSLVYRSLKIFGNSTIQQIVYEFIFVFHCNYGHIMYYFWNKGR